MIGLYTTPEAGDDDRPIPHRRQVTMIGLYNTKAAKLYGKILVRLKGSKRPKIYEALPN